MHSVYIGIVLIDLIFQNSELLAEGELRSNIDESDKVRDLQDKVADLKAEVYSSDAIPNIYYTLYHVIN